MPDATIIPSLLTVGALGGSFLIFEYYIRNIDPCVTYGLKALSATTGKVLTGIALMSVNSFQTARDPINSLNGWSELVFDFTTQLGYGIKPSQYSTSALTILVWYFIVGVYGRLPESDKSLRMLGRDAKKHIKMKRARKNEAVNESAKEASESTKRGRSKPRKTTARSRSRSKR